MKIKGLCILGSTGSVGTNTLRVVEALAGRFRVVALSAGKNLDMLAKQIVNFSPGVAVVASSDCIEPLRQRVAAAGHKQPLRIVAGTEGQVEAATLAEVDMVVSASHGVTGLKATYEAIRAGKPVGLANKEVMVVAGELVNAAARERKVDILPIDSEHSAVHQCLRSGQEKEVHRLILTGSGGPFRKTPRKEFAAITPQQALRHPVWKMGARITVDSATLMNKGLEIIEAHWLFGLESAKIEVLIHPESIVHSMIEFQDGSIMAQLAVADMRLPIQYALTYPERVDLNGDALRLDLAGTRRLSFSKPGIRRFPCLALGREALEQGGLMPCALNAADEIAVEAFLAGGLRFTRIPEVIEEVMRQTPASRPASLEDVLECDHESRARAQEAVARIQ
jgi:1-deoxy-D-xylulose-5-phosphate reductoisomerase